MGDKDKTKDANNVKFDFFNVIDLMIDRLLERSALILKNEIDTAPELDMMARSLERLYALKLDINGLNAGKIPLVKNWSEN